MTIFTKEELVDLARDVEPDSPVTVDRDGLRFVFRAHYDDESVIDQINGVDCYGQVAWPVRDRYSDHERRPDGFTGAARKFGPNQMHDAIWWEPYREGRKVYDSPEDARFMRELLQWGFIGVSVTVLRQESCGHFHEAANESLWGIESPLCHNPSNYEYIADIYDDLIYEALRTMHQERKEAS